MLINVTKPVEFVKLQLTRPLTRSLTGDVDGDGELDIVIVAVSPTGGAHVWALRGSTGAPLPGSIHPVLAQY